MLHLFVYNSSSVFFSCLIRFNRRICTIALFLIAIGLVYSWTNKNYRVRQINSNMEILAQLHDRLNKRTDDWTLIMPSEDSLRIKQMEKQNNSIEIFYDKKSIQDVSEYVEKHRSIDKKILFALTIKKSDDDQINQISDFSKCQHVLSVFSNAIKKKRIQAYTVESNAELHILSQNKSIEPESGILKNGDLEELDSPEQSYKKLESHIGSYSLFYDFDESVRTPVNAYFHNDPSFTQYLPYYNCLNDYAISGKNSARVIISKGSGFTLFLQKFYSGTYQYSVTSSGEKGSTVCILYDLFSNNKWTVIPLATYKIPSNGIFQIRTSFSISNLESGDFFFVGAWVKGKAYLDNFCLKTEE